jgi:pyruvate dehydrogenase E2 component (dihydrolipoyllysine-residue acetyltransferase)
MPTEVIVPKVDMVMESGTFVEWLKKEGERVERGDPLFIITTDKANIEAESPATGTLAGLKAKPGDVLPVTQVIAYILGPGESLPSGNDGAQPSPVVEAVAAAPTTFVSLVAPTPAVVGGKIRATPLARKLAQEMGVDLARVPGRGPHGRVHKADVLSFSQQSTAAPAPRRAPQSPPAAPAEVAQALAPVAVPLPNARRKNTFPLAGARKIIADRMSASAFSAPHINLSLRVDMTETVRLRERLLEPLQARTGQRISYTAILARAVATVLPRHPNLNASLDGTQIVQWEDVHLGIATSVEDSLIVPVIREAQTKNLEQIVCALADLTERGRNKKLLPSEMTGSTFTISNLGMFGVESFTAIINPPESAILAVGKTVDTPVPTGEGFTFKPMLHLTCCADHRIVDGAGVARFLADLKTTLENPYLLI